MSAAEIVAGARVVTWIGVTGTVSRTSIVVDRYDVIVRATAWVRPDAGGPEIPCAVWSLQVIA